MSDNALESFLRGDQAVPDRPQSIVQPDKQPFRLETTAAPVLVGMEFGELRAPVDALIVEGLTLLCGASKLGKSWFVLSMCCAVASGKPFLERKTQQGSVLYLALEDSLRRLKERIQRLDEVISPQLSFAIKSRTLEDGLLDELTDWVNSVENPRLIVIDTLQKVRGPAPARANAYQQDYTAMGRLKAFADAHRIAVVLVHHLNKMQTVTDPYDRISGSTGLMGAADSTLLLTRERGSDDAVLSYTGRDIWGDDLALRMTENGRWNLVSAETAAREGYERNHIVRVCKELLLGNFHEIVKVSVKDLREAVRDRTGYTYGPREFTGKLKALAPQLLHYDEIVLSLGKRVGSERGLWLSMGAPEEECDQADFNLQEDDDDLEVEND